MKGWTRSLICLLPKTAETESATGKRCKNCSPANIEDICAEVLPWVKMQVCS